MELAASTKVEALLDKGKNYRDKSNSTEAPNLERNVRNLQAEWDRVKDMAKNIKQIAAHKMKEQRELMESAEVKMKEQRELMKSAEVMFYHPYVAKHPFMDELCRFLREKFEFPALPTDF